MTRSDPPDFCRFTDPERIQSDGAARNLTARWPNLGAPYLMARLVQYPADKAIVLPDQAEVIGVVVRGYLRVQRYGDERRHIVSLLTPGDLVCQNDVSEKSNTLQAATKSVLCLFDGQAFDAMAQTDIDLARMVYRMRLFKLEQLALLTWMQGVLNAEERICAFVAIASKFMPFAGQADGTGLLTVVLPRLDIADLLGTTVETISRVTNRLAAQGVIAIVNPRQFRILDLARLVQMGCLENSFDLIHPPFGLVPQDDAYTNPTAVTLPQNRPTLSKLFELLGLANLGGDGGDTAVK